MCVCVGGGGGRGVTVVQALETPFSSYVFLYIFK